MERHSEAGIVEAGSEYKAVNIPSELQVERADSIALVGWAGVHRYMDIISNFVQWFSWVSLWNNEIEYDWLNVVNGISYANGWYNELVGAFRPVSREIKAPFLRNISKV